MKNTIVMKRNITFLLCAFLIFFGVSVFASYRANGRPDSPVGQPQTEITRQESQEEEVRQSAFSRIKSELRQDNKSKKGTTEKQYKFEEYEIAETEYIKNMPVHRL